MILPYLIWEVVTYMYTRGAFGNVIYMYYDEDNDNDAGALNNPSVIDFYMSRIRQSLFQQQCYYTVLYHN